MATQVQQELMVQLECLDLKVLQAALGNLALLEQQVRLDPQEELGKMVVLVLLAP